MDKQFIYKAKDFKGETVEGTIVAKTTRDAALILHTQNLIVLEITEKKKVENFLNKELDFRFKSVSINDFSCFCRQFHIVLSAGLPILKCLELIENETSNKGFAKEISGVYLGIQSGESLSKAMIAYPKSFPALFVFMVEAGEMSGNLTQILLGMAEYYETEEKNRRQLQQLLFYPMILGIVFMIVLIFLLTYVLPTFVGMFETMDAVLPRPTQFLLDISQLLTTQWPMMVLILVGSTLGLIILLELPNVARVKDYIKITLPIIGSLNKKRCLTMIATTLGMFLTSGIDLLSALNRLEGVTDNLYIKGELEILEKKVSNGTRLGQGMGESNVFPSLFCQLVTIGEESGSLAEMLETIHRIYKDEISNRIQLLSTSLEPLILIVFGGVVLFILAAIMLPVFDIYSVYSNM